MPLKALAAATLLLTACAGTVVEGASTEVGFSPGAGILSLDDDELDRELEEMAALGARWIRVDFDWPSIEPEPGQFEWDATDRIVESARARDLDVLALPTYTPEWARPSGFGDKHPPTDVADYARFLTEAVGRYEPLGVSVWEIWNEPNVAQFWEPKPDIAAYGQLVDAASAAIRAVDPEAFVLSGGLAPADDSTEAAIAPLTFLRGLYDMGHDAFDGVAVHPYSYPAAPLDAEPWNSFAALPGLRAELVAEGDGAKSIWLTEYGAPTGDSSRAVSPDDQARFVTEAVDVAGVWSWTGPILLYSYRDAGTDAGDAEDNFGLVDREFSPKPALEALRAELGA